MIPVIDELDIDVACIGNHDYVSKIIMFTYYFN